MKTRLKIQVILFYRDANKNKFFLLLKTNKKRESFWQNITGGVDPGESYIEAAIRELEEETSIQENLIINIQESKLSFNFHDQWGYDVTEKVFFIEVKDGSLIKIDPAEHDEFKWENIIKKDSVKFESNYIALQEAEKLD